MITRPQPDEYPAYAGTYISMVPAGADVLQVLADSQVTTYDMLAHLPEDKAMHAYTEGKWTVKQVLGHMIDTERTFAYRAFCFSRDSVALPGFDQEVYVNNTDFNSRTIKSLADEFKATRQSNLFMFSTLTEEQLNRKGVASDNPVTVRALLFATAGHELYHLNILREKYLV